MMKKIVVKFGGSNLKQKEDFAKLIRVITLYRQPIIIVISALYGVTNILADAIRTVKTNEKAIRDLLQNLQDAHYRVIDLYSGANDTEKAREAKKKIAERLSSLVLTSILNFNKIPCRECLPETLGLVTNGEFRNAVVDFSAARPEVKQRLCLAGAGDKICIIPGFYGIAPDARVTLFGRGGSDYTAAAIACCVDAASVDLWKDVPGFMSADPKLVENPSPIPYLGYNEAAELSYFGARILHPRTFEPVIEAKIPVRLFNINDFSDDLKPVTNALPHLWYNTPNLHFLTISDFETFVSARNITVLERYFYTHDTQVAFRPNLFAMNAIYVITR